MTRLATNIVRVSVAAAAWVCGAAAGQVIDDFEGPLAWKALPSDGVSAAVRLEKDAGGGSAMRVDYDFAKGMGFVVVRRELNLEVPENYRFSFRVRGDGPANNFEFKLVEAKDDGKGGFTPGDDVWWVNNRAYEWPAAWKRVAYRNRHVAFAWGPGGGKAPLRRVGAIEFAVAAAKGGKGTVWIDDLRLDAVARTGEEDATLEWEGLTAEPKHAEPRFGADEAGRGALWWLPEKAWSLTARFKEPREIGGVQLQAPEGTYEVSTSLDGTTWERVGGTREVRGRSVWLRTPGLEATAVRVRSEAGAPGSPPCVLSILGPTVGDDMNAMLRAMARLGPANMFPRYLRDEATSWTVIGLPGGEHEALLSADGQLEMSKGGFAVEPFIQVEEAEGVTRWVSWADGRVRHFLNPGASPAVEWEADQAYDGLRLTITAAETGTLGMPGVTANYSLTGAPYRLRARIVAAVRPMQALPPSQWLNVTGGFSPIRTIEARADGRAAALIVNGQYPVIPFGTARTSMLVGNGTNGEFGSVAERALTGGDFTTTAATATDEDGLAWGAIVTPWQDLTPNATITLCVGSSLRPMAAGETVAAWKDVATRFDPSASTWGETLGRVQLKLPSSARAVEETWRVQQRLIMVNADGPSLQPGSRTYERAWIRDGASIGTAMCFTGHADMMREFVDWYGPFQYENGKIPCVVDARGPDPVPEHDSHGEYIHAVATVYRFTRDRAFLERHWPRVVKAVAYIDSLVAERSTDRWRLGDARFADGGGKVPEHAAYGLVPESISHEGYSAKPMHSFWDSFWTLRGLKDAAFIAAELGKDERAGFVERAAAYRKNVAASAALVSGATGIDWMPGCVELADFDATSTAVAVWPTDEWRQAGGVPSSVFYETFTKYWDFFTSRRLGQKEWRDYTPYEVRIIGAMLRLGEDSMDWLPRAHALNEWFLKDQRPEGWRQWGEVVYRDKRFAGFIGDYPHTWVGADYLNSVRAMFIDEREGAEGGDGELVLGLGISNRWLDEAADQGVGIRGAPTWFGTLSYTVRREPDRTLRWVITPELRRGSGVSALTLMTPSSAASARVVRGGAEVQSAGGRKVRLTGAFRDVLEVEVRE